MIEKWTVDNFIEIYGRGSGSSTSDSSIFLIFNVRRIEGFSKSSWIFFNNLVFFGENFHFEP